MEVAEMEFVGMWEFWALNFNKLIVGMANLGTETSSDPFSCENFRQLIVASFDSSTLKVISYLEF